ncbi:hypothetical protein [Streptomyces sp. NPDC018693]|uniref:hypothetical protein n=1 Tax=unclassified Streptomyces TaxID=2593676 RepID=UPI0037993578
MKQTFGRAFFRTRIPGLLRGEPSLALLGVLGGAFTGLVGSLLVARFLSPSERGHYATVVVFTMLALACLQMGGEVGVLRGITDTEDGGASFLAGYLHWTLVSSAAVGIVAAAASPAVPWLQPLWLVPLCATAAVYSGLVARMTAGILVNSGGLRRLILARTVANCGTIPGCLLCLSLGLTSALQVATLSFVVQGALNSFLFVRARSAVESPITGSTGWWKGRKARHRTMALVWRRGNVHLHVLSGSTYVVQRSDQMALSALGADRTLGLYAVAMNVSEVIGYLPAALYPLLSRGRPDRPVPLRRLLLLLAVCVAAVTPLAYFGLPFLYGAEYEAAQPAVLLLVPASGIFAVGRMVQGIELRDPERRMNLALIALAAAAIEFAAVFLVGASGVMAVALACSTSYAVFTAWVAFTRTNKTSSSASTAQREGAPWGSGRKIRAEN